MIKPNVTRTLGPIHFEDLDPHRFEDLIRQLAYDFRQWQSIESTGRGGSDDGFDIRAYETAPTLEAFGGDEDEPEDAPHPMEGHLWMIQCKREKSLGPKRVAAIINHGVVPNAPPYGYILAAPANFSKASHDAFREKLRERGVMEFYLWGAGELEDMLYQPKNDHILFAFFGISLSSRRRSRATEIRATVGAKNKLLRILGDDPSFKPVLLRDIKDTHYPYKKEYSDFDERPRWKKYLTVKLHPLGLAVSIGGYYAYFDKTKAECDFTKMVNQYLAMDGQPLDEKRIAQGNAVKGFWEQLPHATKATYVRNGLVRFDAIVFIDDKGDSEYDCPHVFIDFRARRGPFWGFSEYLEMNESYVESLDKLKRVDIFPNTFPEPEFGTIHENKVITLDDKAYGTVIRNRDRVTLYCAHDQYAYLEPTDVVGAETVGQTGRERQLLKITNVRRTKGKELLNLTRDDAFLGKIIETQIGRELNPGDWIQIVEAVTIYDWQVDQNRPVV